MNVPLKPQCSEPTRVGGNPHPQPQRDTPMRYEDFIRDKWKNATVDNYYKMSAEDRKKVTEEDAHVMAEIEEDAHGSIYDEMGGYDYWGMGEEGFERLDIIKTWWNNVFREPFPTDPKKVLE